MLRMTAMYVPKRELPSSSCIPGSKSFPGVPAPCGGGNTQKNGKEEKSGGLPQEDPALPRQFVP